MYKKQLALFINYIWMEYRSAEVFQKYEVTHHKGGVYTQGVNRSLEVCTCTDEVLHGSEIPCTIIASIFVNSVYIISDAGRQ
jgi:hypothetical protein